MLRWELRGRALKRSLARFGVCGGSGGFFGGSYFSLARYAKRSFDTSSRRVTAAPAGTFGGTIGALWPFIELIPPRTQCDGVVLGCLG